MKKKNKYSVLDNILVEDYAAEGKALARKDGKVIFITGAVPGDIVDILVLKNKKDWAEGKAIKFHEYSKQRVEPFCEHFGTCGGCKWQMLPYHLQLQYKQQEAEQNLRRIGKIDLPDVRPIEGANPTKNYRNKLEFTFSNKRYLTFDQIQQEQNDFFKNTLGFHAPAVYDKVIDINTCYLQAEPSNLIRQTLKEFALQNEYTFYDAKKHTGWLRNLIIRICSTGEIMVNLCLAYEDENETNKILNHLLLKVPNITTILYTINPKWNDSLNDLTPKVFYGKGYVFEKLENLFFKIGPKSFFQTNTFQAEKLYQITRSFAKLTGNEIVYDLYCGTGSIGLFVSHLAKKIIGVEVIEEAIEDAKENARLNNIDKAAFLAGDVIKICDDAFFEKHGKPDVIITDPPRAGMHEKLVQKLLQIAAPRIVYVSCNTATQARDIQLLSEKYIIESIQPVDMFPHTHHIECVAALILKNN